MTHSFFTTEHPGPAPTLDLVVVGLGYVGLPLVHAASSAGLRVAGLDRSPRVVAGLNSGTSHIDDLEDTDVKLMVANNFFATDDPEVIRHAENVVICVPTPLTADGGPDLGAVKASVEAVSANLRPGALVVLESTTYPGTTEEVVLPMLTTDGRVVGRDFFLAFSPERIDPGNATFGIQNTPKIVGGQTAECADRAVRLYEHFVDSVVRAKGTREAEMAKLLENTYRHVNIALVNEMARFSHELGIDLWDSIRCASTKPFGFHAFYPGPGVGGHCIPIDPNYLSHNVRSKLGYPFRFVELAQEINAGMPGYVFRRAQDILNLGSKSVSGSTVLILGVTYKADIADQRESPIRPLAQLLIDAGATVVYHDPHVEEWAVGGRTLNCTDDLWAALESCDLAILTQQHKGYDKPTLRHAKLLLDTRGVMDAAEGVFAL